MIPKATLRAGKFLGKALVEAHPYLIIVTIRKGSLYSLLAKEETDTEYLPASIVGSISSQEIRMLVNPPDGMMIFNETSCVMEIYDKQNDEWRS